MTALSFESSFNGSWDTCLRGVITRFIAESPLNLFRNGVEEPIWEEALIGFAAGNDPIFESYKEHVGPFHFTPEELFRLSFPNEDISASELTVISWALIQRDATKRDNRKVSYYPSERWLRSRAEGEDFNAALRAHVVEILSAQNVQALAPQLSPHWRMEMSPVYGYASRWSERHAAYAAGLGTFGLCDGLITAKGKAHRVGSVIARVQIPAVKRPYSNHREYCLFFTNGKCRACIERCPVGALSEKGHDKNKCFAHVHEDCAEYCKDTHGFSAYGCGLCQTKVPCESGIPTLNMRGTEK